MFALQRHPDYDAAALYQEHRRWNDRHALPLAKSWHAHLNDPAPDRRLRVSYVSPQLLPNSVARFLVPLLSNHDHRQFEIVWYAGMEMPDDPGGVLRRYVDEWKPAWNLSDEELATTVRADDVDLLVDLSMHIAGNRPLVFARKPAPVQVTYLAYCGTTGLQAMDYRITDPYLDPPGQDDEHYSERSVRLPETYWCYPPNEQVDEVGPPPAAATGRATFGCLNAFSKVARAGASILSNVGLRELLANDPDQYLAIAMGLARDVGRLEELRAGLRERMKRSPLMDGPRFARHMEAAYRDMWRRWANTRR